MWHTLLLAAAWSPDLTPARVELLSGRADLAGPDGVTALVEGSRGWSVDGPAYLELGAASRLALRWRGEASLELRGSTALEWRVPSDQRGVLVVAWRLDELDFEVRRGPLRIELGGGWRAELELGAGTVRSLGDGRLELRHVAGAPLALFHEASPGLVSPPWTVLPGTQVRLEPGAALTAWGGATPTRVAARPSSGATPRLPRGSPSAAQGARAAPGEAAPWRSFSWPWRAPEPAGAASSPAPVPEREPRDAAPARIESSRAAPATARDDAIASEATLDALDGALELPDRRWGASLDPRLTPLLDADASGTDRAPIASPVRAPSVEAADPALRPSKAGPRSTGDERAASEASPPPAAGGAPGLARPALAPPLFDLSSYPPIRRHGELISTPFGPRWADRP